MAKKVGVIVGSLRKASWNRKIALTLMKLAPSSLALSLVEIGELPLYNQDLDEESHPPKPWVDFREKMHAMEAFLFVTPEYNRSIPAPMKNAIDVGSRPYGKGVWSGKPGAIVSASPGPIGGFAANQQLRQAFVCLNVFLMQTPEAYLGKVNELFAADGETILEGPREFLHKFMESYAAWVSKF